VAPGTPERGDVLAEAPAVSGREAGEARLVELDDDAGGPQATAHRLGREPLGQLPLDLVHDGERVGPDGDAGLDPARQAGRRGKLGDVGEPEVTRDRPHAGLVDPGVDVRMPYPTLVRG